MIRKKVYNMADRSVHYYYYYRPSALSYFYDHLYSLVGHIYYIRKCDMDRKSLAD